MATLQSGQTISIQLAEGESYTVTPSGTAQVSTRGVSGSELSAPRTLTSAQTFGPYTEAGAISSACLSGTVDYTQAGGPVYQDPTGALVGVGHVQIKRGLRPIRRQSGVELFGPSATTTITATPGSGATITSSGLVTINGESYYNLQFTAISAVQNYVELNINGLTPFSGDHATVEFLGQMPVSSVITPYLGTAAYAQFVTNTFAEQAATGVSELFNDGLRSFSTRDDQWTKNNFTGTWASTQVREMSWSVAKVRVTVPNGFSVNVNLRSLRVGSRPGVGSLCIVADDGYESVYYRALPLFESYGIPLTAAIIPQLVGTPGYMTEAQLRDMVRRGHLCVAHGPLQNLTNLFDSPYTTTAQRVADAQASAQWLLDRGLTTEKGARCYVWPQGRYAAGTSASVELVAALQAAGFTHGRGVSSGSPSPSIYRGALSDLAMPRLLWPIIGHTYAGAANTPDDATETTNINTIVSRIQALGTYGLDGHLMLHKFVARGAASNGIEIELDRCKTLLSAAATEVAAGRLDCVLMDDLAY